MKIEKKAWPELFQAVLDGKKNFDVRLNDFEANEGDILVLKEWDPEKNEYTGRVLEKEIKFIMRTNDLKFWSKEEKDEQGLQVFGF